MNLRAQAEVIAVTGEDIVAHAAAWLDIEKPLWYFGVNESIIWINSPRTCVAGQVFAKDCKLGSPHEYAERLLKRQYNAGMISASLRNTIVSAFEGDEMMAYWRELIQERKAND